MAKKKCVCTKAVVKANVVEIKAVGFKKILMGLGTDGSSGCENNSGGVRCFVELPGN